MCSIKKVYICTKWDDVVGMPWKLRKQWAQSRLSLLQENIEFTDKLILQIQIIKQRQKV